MRPLGAIAIAALIALPVPGAERSGQVWVLDAQGRPQLVERPVPPDPYAGPVQRKPHPAVPDLDKLEYPPPAGDSEYDRKLRQYYESQACFARFRNANGSVKAEAFEVCAEVPFPPRD